jgi:hypothetical protein
MALVLADRVQETSTTSGTGTLTLNGAVNGFQSFANGVGNGNTCYYTIYDTVAYTWEVGVGTYTTSGSTLTRTTVLSNSSQTTSLINFAGNLMNVWVDYPAEKAVSTDTLAYPPAIGGTTPAAGTFTTATVAGGLQNLFLQSQTFNTSPWGNTALTINQTATTAPDSTSTGNSLIPTAVSSIHRITQGVTITAGVTYTASVYAKANGYNYLYFNCGSAFNGTTTFNISTGTVTNINSGTATITSAGNGWYRCTITGTATATSAPSLYIQVNSTQTLATDDTFTGDGTSGIYLWGAQLETSPTVHAYQVTTTVAASSNPRISLSGGGSLGLQSDGSLYVSPAGTGALQAQATTSTATGGNARGANAVDWQTSRSAANLVASGGGSVIAGGLNNRANGFYSSVSGGVGNAIGGAYGIIGSGNVNTASGDYCVIGGGAYNTVAGFFNFIGAGFTNSGTSNAAVTTQSATMNGTTAVTLAATNASIKVGQYIQGTSIANYTYVAAISGTSLTLSQNASGSSTSTLSFYTPHGVVVGGGNNQATGAYSFIGGGGDAGVAANRNVASGDWSFVGGGIGNTNAGAGAVIVGGGYTGSGVVLNSITSTGSYAAILGGKGNTISSIGGVVLGADNNASGFVGSSVLGGRFNQSNGIYSSVVGGANATNRGINGHFAFGIGATTGSINGQFQSSLLSLYVQTTTTGATPLTSDFSTTNATNQMVLPNGASGTVSVYTFRVLISAHNSANTTDIAGWEIKGVISRGNGVGTTALVGTPTVTLLGATTGAITAGWGTVSNVAAVADTTYGALQITVTGVASTTIRWSATVEANELAY